jgi:hypothetical protein
MGVQLAEQIQYFLCMLTTLHIYPDEVVQLACGCQHLFQVSAGDCVPEI